MTLQERHSSVALALANVLTINEIIFIEIALRDRTLQIKLLLSSRPL